MKQLPPVVSRFLEYVAYDTQSSQSSKTAPSTEKQLVLLKRLADDLRRAGVADARLTRGGIVMGSVPATPGCESCPAVGFLAHVDTATETSGKDIKPRIVENYQGGDIVLNEEKNIVLSPKRFPNLHKYLGDDLIVTDGTTLLGADDKSGVSAIMGLALHLQAHPEMPHAKICFAYTPDEEVGRGVENFDVKEFGADYAYTVDGSTFGRLSFQTFHAAGAEVTFRGIVVHPGYAKDKMKNALVLAADFVHKIPKEEQPQNSGGFEGYWWPHDLKADGAVATVGVNIRDFDRKRFEERKAQLRQWALEVDPEAEVVITDRYPNMEDFLRPVPHVVELARRAYRDCGVKPVEDPVRGGTDGATLSARGLPCPNVFQGGENAHGPFEFVAVNSLVKSEAIVIRLAELSATVRPGK